MTAAEVVILISCLSLWPRRKYIRNALTDTRPISRAASSPARNLWRPAVGHRPSALVWPNWRTLTLGGIRAVCGVSRVRAFSHGCCELGIHTSNACNDE